MFRIIVPLDDEYSFDYGTENSVSIGNNENNGTQNADKMPINADKMPINNLSAQQKKILQLVEKDGHITSQQTALLLDIKQRRARAILGEMVEVGVLERQGSYKSTVYVMRK